MEKLVTIIEQFPLASRPYTAKDGTPLVFNSRGFLLSDGVDEFYAEMTGDAALSCPDYDPGQLHAMQGYLRHRTFVDKNGVTRHENLIFINKLV